LASPASNSSNHTTKHHSKASTISSRSNTNLSFRTPQFHLILLFMLNNNQTHIKHTKVTLTELEATALQQMALGTPNDWPQQLCSTDPPRNATTQKGVPIEPEELTLASLFLSINLSCYTISH
jgi:hypothetical protein